MGILSFRENNSVPVVKLHGTIAGGNPRHLNADSTVPMLKKAFDLAARSKHKTVVLDINSPGGSPYQSQQIASTVRKLAGEKDVKVLTVANEVAASGGYWLMCAGDELYAADMSIVGSIGVVSSLMNYSELAKKLGVENRVITQGENKARLNPFSEIKETDVEWVKKRQAKIHTEFKNWVSERRGDKIDTKDAELFSGETFSGKEAKAKGLVDDTVISMDTLLEDKFGKDYRPVTMKKSAGGLSALFGALANPVAYVLNEIQARVETKISFGQFGIHR